MRFMLMIGGHEGHSQSGPMVRFHGFQASNVYACEPMPRRRQWLADNLKNAGCADGGRQSLPETSGT
jgi:hypothetical protein